MIILKVLCLMGVAAAAMEATTEGSPEYHSDYYHSVVVQGHVKKHGGGGPQAEEPSLVLADAPNRMSRERYPEHYYAGLHATYHPLELELEVEQEPYHQEGRALISHHGKLVKGLHGFAGLHGAHVIGPLGFSSHHGGLVKTPKGLAGHHSKFHHFPHGGGYVSHGGFLLGKSARPPPSPLPQVPGLIRGGAAIAAYNTQGHDQHKLLHGQGAHKYKHFSLDRGFVNPCVPQPFHVVHADHGYDDNAMYVGGGGYNGANNVYGLGGKLGLL